MLWMKWKMVVDSLRGRRRRLPCFLWFLLLFAVGGLVLFIHQQDLSDMVQQQVPGPDTEQSLSGGEEAVPGSVTAGTTAEAQNGLCCCEQELVFREAISESLCVLSNAGFSSISGNKITAHLSPDQSGLDWSSEAV
ncbi:unnamed protein product [Pleuronectes platessa]|uniref:Uncharacterized protein n=1 Tax=Pleuronectes platessa TaxID=8262 RepID=A0A9N7YMT8_PLEPL|nr:unnamed protein product [Pleuronectes platessa]